MKINLYEMQEELTRIWTDHRTSKRNNDFRKRYICELLEGMIEGRNQPSILGDDEKHNVFDGMEGNKIVDISYEDGRVILDSEYGVTSVPFENISRLTCDEYLHEINTDFYYPSTIAF